jgi:hypothetical protein
MWERYAASDVEYFGRAREYEALASVITADVTLPVLLATHGLRAPASSSTLGLFRMQDCGTYLGTVLYGCPFTRSNSSLFICTGVTMAAEEDTNMRSLVPTSKSAKKHVCTYIYVPR